MIHSLEEFGFATLTGQKMGTQAREWPCIVNNVHGHGIIWGRETVTWALVFVYLTKTLIRT